MANLYREISRDFPDRVCLSYKGNKWTYRQFIAHVGKLADTLMKKGVRQGDRVGLRLPEPSELLVGYYACFKLGAAPVPIPFIDSERIAGAMEAANISIMVESLALNDDVAECQERPSISEPVEAMVIFTSGTTSSKLKGVRLSNSGVSSTCQFMNEKMEVDSDIRECVYAAVDHAFGFGRCHSVLKLGGTISLLKIDQGISDFLEVLEQDDCNALSAPPSILSTIIRVLDGNLSEIAERIRWVQTGAMRFDTTFRKSLINSLPNSRIFLHYGLSEAMRVTFFEINKHRDKLHTEGPSSRGVQLGLFDRQNMPVGKGDEGNIGIRGTNLCLGYLDNELWQSCLHNGWFITSDRGRFDDDGFLIFCGRSDDTINANGVLIHPDEIESKIQAAFPALSFSVAGLPDPQGIKDKIIAIFVEGGEVSLASIKKGLSDTDRNLVPQKLFEVENLPKTRSGKVNRVELVARHSKL